MPTSSRPSSIRISRIALRHLCAASPRLTIATLETLSEIPIGSDVFPLRGGDPCLDPRCRRPGRDNLEVIVAVDEHRVRKVRDTPGQPKNVEPAKPLEELSLSSRLDAELSRETSMPVDLRHLLATVADIYRMLQLPRGVTLDLDVPPDNIIVMGRDERLGQVFRNLIDNAVSFSPDGGTVAIAAQVLGGRARVTVEDEGPGIPPENLETIFRRFYTERPTEHGFGKNSGLGLSIARQIVEGIGGTIWAENRAGGTGARFVVELPLMRRG